MLPLSRFLAVWPPLTMVTKIASAKNGSYNPDEARPPTGRELRRRWQFVSTALLEFPLRAAGNVAPPPLLRAPKVPVLQ
jgi:hypothetical protein